ncbi:hypothetical protein EJ110_NYTH08865 [Nymphaea thermarum]|nr:hypothetical protein EJ110_NYTH08865 [Nymphaea thermarum]
MEWTTLQHLDLRHVDRGHKALQPHAAAFHPNQAIMAVAVGSFIVEFDALTGSKISSIDIGAPVVRMLYSPTSGHTVIAVLEDCTIRSCDFDNEQTAVLHSPEKRNEQIAPDTEVHIALTPLQPIVFFGFHRRMSVTVVGTVEGGRAPTKIKTDLKKPIVNLACHPRLPLLYVAYAEGLIRAYNIHTYAVHYTLQIDNTIKLIGAGAFAFHPTLEWIFIGDRRGSLLAWDVSTERPNMIGIKQIGSQPIISIAWHPMLRLLITLSKDGNLQVWRTLVITNPNRQPMQANFFERAGIEPIDITGILSQRGGEAVYPLPRIKSIIVHPKLNLATILFAGLSTGGNSKSKAASFTREGRKQLFAVLQSARGSTAADLKEKLSSLGSSGVLAEHQLQTQLQEQHTKGQSQLSITDIARKAFLHSHFMEGHAKSGPISRLPLITIVDSKHHLRDVPVCQPYHLELNFFNGENRILHYPVRAFYLDSINLMAYNICSGVDNIYKKLYSTIPVNGECYPKSLVYSSKQHLFLVVFETNGNGSEVVVHWEQTDAQSIHSKGGIIKGRDAAFIGVNENQYAILDDDKTGLTLYFLQATSSAPQDKMSNGSLDPESFTENTVVLERGAMQFTFESEVDRIFSTPLESMVMYASHGSHIGLTKLVQGYTLSTDHGQNLSTKKEGKQAIRLKMDEIVIQVQWQETLRGHVAGILTTHRVMIVTKDLVILAIIGILGWDGMVRTILSISIPNAVLVGALNDRILLASPTDINPRQKKGVEIRSCLVGLLEPLLIGFATMQQSFEQKINVPEILYQLTSRFDSLRISSRSLDILAKGPPACGDLAVALAQAGPQFTQVLRCMYAIKALRFSTALSVLKDEFLRSRDYPQCPPTSQLFYRFRHLGYSCIKHGQFDSAKETFEVITDFQSMLDLFICHLNPSAMRNLAQKLEDVGTDSELRRYCERILRIRSTGWTQGIFANFAAESMVPKGPEWGGGNWEIKTPTDLKSIPQWELAGEVMPYMKTFDGIIPSIIADHIGVYLGVMKGRGNVIEVREDSLVKTITALNGEKKNKTSADGETKADSLNSLANLMKPNAGPTADEQAKAEEEFKKPYGVDGSSSDEEEGTSKKKIVIKIKEKPAAGATVDVNKIKEATKQFKLGDGLGPPIRARSSPGGSQDFTAAFSQPFPVSTTATLPPMATVPPTAVFPPTSVAAPTAEPTAMVMGMGVSAGPIPEDFFQNTISSLAVAAALAPPAKYFGGLDQPRIPESSSVSSNQINAPINIGLPDGGVPPQVASQQSASSFESIGLPDGGIPPQSVVPQSVAPQPAAAAAPAPVVAQPIDLGVLVSQEANVGTNGGKSTPAAPIAVRLGQVPRGAAAPVCFKTALAHLEQNQLADSLSCLDEAFLALAKDLSQGADVKAQASICAQYKIAVALLQEIGRLQKVQGPSAISAKEEMARLSRHLGSLPLRANHRINCIRTSIKRNMEVQNYGYAKSMLDLLLSKAPPGKQDELRSLIDICVQRGLTNKSIDPLEDASQFCAATLSRLSTIGHDACDLCGAKFAALTGHGCSICGMGSIKRSDSQAGPVPSPFG